MVIRELSVIKWEICFNITLCDNKSYSGRSASYKQQLSLQIFNHLSLLSVLLLSIRILCKIKIAQHKGQ